MSGNAISRKRDRQEAVRKQRRVIFNDDAYELDRDDANTAEGFLSRRLRPLIGTHVDTIAFSVLEGDAPVYDSNAQPIFGDAHEGPPPYWKNFTPNNKALSKAGHCPLKVVTDFAHENGMEAFASIRINDVHDTFIPGWITKWKHHHPEYLVDTADMPPHLELYVNAQDFVHEAVRHRKLEIVQ